MEATDAKPGNDEDSRFGMLRLVTSVISTNSLDAIHTDTWMLKTLVECNTMYLTPRKSVLTRVSFFLHCNQMGYMYS